MQHYYRLTVPTTLGTAPAPADLVEALRAQIKRAFAVAFGGYTETPANGGWLNADGELVEEPVYVIEAAFEIADDDLVWRLARTIKARLEQEAVMIHKDLEVFLV
jgi:hypothetical protein